jgi:hypothetical protein
MKIHLMSLFSNLFLFSLGTYTNASQPKTLFKPCEIEGFLSNHTSCGFEWTSVDEGYQSIKYLVVLSTSAHNSYMIPTSMSMVLALSINSLFIISETPFFLGYMVWYFSVLCHTICRISQNPFHRIHLHCHFSTPNIIICLVFNKRFKLFEFLKKL